jgi:hypothetical protein
VASITYPDNQLSVPAWAAEGRGAHSLIPGGAKLDANQFLATDAVIVTLTANAAADATTLAVAALSGPIPSGVVLYFGESKELAMLTAAAAAGATSLTVQALPAAIENGDKATYAGSGMKPKTVKAGTLIGRTYAERDAGTGFGPADVATPDDEIYLLAFDVSDAVKLNDCELYRHTCLVKEAMLPNWSTLTTQQKAAIRSRYQCISAQA